MSVFSSFNTVFLPNNSSINNNNNNMCEEPNNNAQIYENLDQSTIVVSAHSNNEAPSGLSITNKNTVDSSSIITQSSNDKMTQKNTPMNRKRKCIVGSFANSAHSKDMREVKGKKKKKMKDDEEKNMSKEEKKCEKLAILEEAPKGYIHVRARRGQATDSHSLAERVRREKIREKMKLLQSIVPGCDKVTGKALMLDIIINYIQSLQNQVEFLSLKLTSVNPMSCDFGLDMEPFMITPDQNLPSSLPTMHEISPTTANNYTLLDNSVNSLLFHQSQIPSDMPQGSRHVLWEMEDQRQKIINQSGFSNNLFLLHY